MMSKLIITSLLFLSFAVEAADKKVVYMALWRGITDAEQGFIDYLESRQGLDVQFVFDNADKDILRVADFHKAIRTLKPDLIYTFGTTVSLTVAGPADNINSRVNITDIPIVFNIVADPVGAKLSPKFGAGSGRNLTGASHLVPPDTQLNAMYELGGINHIGVIYNADEKNSVLQVENIRLWISDQKQLSLFPVDSKKEPEVAISEAVAEASNKGVDLLYLPSDSYLISNGDYLKQAAINHKVPVFSATEGPVKEGQALTGLVSKYYLVGQLAGYKAYQILTGTSVDTIPIETLSKFNTVVNLEVAKNLDYYPPVNLLLNATIYH